MFRAANCLLLRIQVMWDVMLCYWVIGFNCLQDQVAFISKGQSVHEDLTLPDEGTVIL